MAVNDPQTELRFLPAAAEYLPSFAEAVDEVARERKFLAATSGFPLEETAAFVGNILRHRLPQFYAVDGEKVVGWCDILPKQFEGMTHVGMLGMGVRKAYRGRGIGSRLLALTLEHARAECGLEKVELEVFGSNRTAIALYERAGFEREGKLINARKLDGVYDHIVLMAKFLK